MKKAYLQLSNGIKFTGLSIGKNFGYSISEIVFNTGMTGYQEVLTDPSYFGQSVCMTYPLIGNYGVMNEDNESRKIWVNGFIVRNLSQFYSNFRAKKDLNQYLFENEILGISNIDTRYLIKILRNHGTMNCILYNEDVKINDDLLNEMNNYKIKNAVQSVSTNNVYTINNENGKFNIALLDFGYKKSIIDELVLRQCNVTVFPANSSIKTILEHNNYDGIMLSNGPGDPSENTSIITNIKSMIKTKIPIFGICLGHQLIALALGASTKKLKYGHRGSNHPVKDLDNNRVYITSQNHGYTVDIDELNNKSIRITHKNVNDNTIEGLEYKDYNIFSVQYHPEASPGPLDSKYLFDKFINRVSVYKTGGK